MPEWWTYTPGDFLMYSPRVYARLLAGYQRDLLPAQAGALAVAVAVAALVRSRVEWRGRAVSAMLAAGWAFVAWAYFVERYATIDWAASWFAGAFAVQALLLLAVGTLGGALVPDPRAGRAARGAQALLLFALFVQPALGAVLAGDVAMAALAGVLPDPTAVATLAFLLMVRGRARWMLLATPLLWCVASGVLAWARGSADALVTLGAAALALGLAAAQRRDPERP